MIETKNAVLAYRYYRDETRKNGKIPQPISIYRAITNGFVKFIMRKVFEGYEVHLSTFFTLGVLALRGIKDKPAIDGHGNITGLAPAWGKTFKLWRENPEAKAEKRMIYCTNEHSNGIRYRLTWLKAGMRQPNKEFYSLKFCRANKRKTRELILEGKEYFIKPEKENYVRATNFKEH